MFFVAGDGIRLDSRRRRRRHGFVADIMITRHIMRRQGSKDGFRFFTRFIVGRHVRKRMNHITQVNRKIRTLCGQQRRRITSAPVRQIIDGIGRGFITSRRADVRIGYQSNRSLFLAFRHGVLHRELRLMTVNRFARPLLQCLHRVFGIDAALWIKHQRPRPVTAAL